MKNAELFTKTVAILVKAYQNDTLIHGNACGCAVGNLIYEPKSNADIQRLTAEPGTDAWYVATMSATYPKLGQAQIKKTGYSLPNIIEIENSFEEAGFRDTDGYLGLMNVVDCLMTIHEATEQEATEAKELFVKA